MNPDRKILTREDILGATLRTREVEVPEWGGVVFVSEFTAKEIQENGKYVMRADGKPDIGKAIQVPVQVCLKKVVDEHGLRLFADSDLPKIEQLHGSAVRRIAEEVQTLSGLKKNTGNDALSRWLQEKYPDIHQEYQDEQDPVKAAEQNFTMPPSGD